jgi:protein-disulfide isomerase
LRSARIVSATRESCLRATVQAVRGLFRNRAVLFAAVGIAAVGIAVGLIVASVAGNGGKKASPATAPTAVGTSATATATRTDAASVTGASETAALFRGIPQKLNVLGNPTAPVTLIEFADLQCPFCRQFTLQALPAILRDYVRPGKVKLVFAGIAFLGPESGTALRATYAAGLQSRLWNFAALLYRNQGGENSGWVTDDLLRSVGKAAGLDVAALFKARASLSVDAAIAAMTQQATKAHVSTTPAFFAGPTGGTLQSVNVTSLKADAFRPALDALVR